MTCSCVPAITVSDLSVAYGPALAVRDVNAAFMAGSLTALAGPNGSGKSTLLKTIAGLLKPVKGRVVIHPDYARSIAYLSQDSFLNRDFPVRVLDCVCAGFLPSAGWFGAIGADRRGQALQAIQSVGLGGFEDRPISDLSGGQFQRMLFARTMVQDARIILLDEPFAAVDAATTKALIDIILDWHKQGRTVICVLHDLLLIRKYFPESVLMAGHCIGAGHTHEMFQQKLLSYDLDMAELFPEGEVVHQHKYGNPPANEQPKGADGKQAAA